MVSILMTGLCRCCGGSQIVTLSGLVWCGAANICIHIIIFLSQTTYRTALWLLPILPMSTSDADALIISSDPLHARVHLVQRVLFSEADLLN